ncbi:MAG TPA: zf-HC2 domain-containing protein [Tepidisphaeraceae bacterium]|jgi:anti-sigma factor RsiW
MNDCLTSEELSAFHDGELDERGRAVAAQHLAECPACARELARLAAMSQLFVQSPDVHLSQIATARLHRRVDAAMEQGLLRIAWTLSGLAASVLLAGSMWLMHEHRAVPQSAPPWVELTAATNPLARDAASPAAQWYLADASGRGEEAP